MVIGVGLVGTGYAARRRAEALADSDRARLLAVSGQSDRAQAIADLYRDRKQDSSTHSGSKVAIESDWTTLLRDSGIDLVIVATRNHLHGPIVKAALLANKHVVVEYPLALEVAEAEALVELRRSRHRLLHVEHIEHLSGIHATLHQFLQDIGEPRYCQSISFKGDHPAPQRWSYNALEFGFPLVAALSRIQRLIDLFGTVETVHCSCQYWNAAGQSFIPTLQQPMYAAVLCTATLTFSRGLLAEVVYGKGECFWSRERRIDIHGATGRLLVEPTGGQLIRVEGSQALTVGSRRGLFRKDTTMVLDALEYQQPLYITPEESLYALRVADAARRSAVSGCGEWVGG
ncbi:MAG: Gfo/Idh/MocA family protein [Leptolyngbyaceae cyanobacterium]